MLPMLVDVVVPTASYYLLHAVGVDDFWALTLAGVLTAGWATVATIRRGRLDSVGVLVVLEIVLSAVLFVVVRDPRIVLLKPSFFTAAAGAYLLWTCWTGRPMTLDTTRPFVLAGGPGREEAADAAWAHEPAFRREHYLVTAAWGVAWLVESVVRGVVVLQTDVATGVWASQIPGLVALVLCLGVGAKRGPVLRRHVEAHVARASQ